MAKDKKEQAAADADARDKYNRGNFQTHDPVTGEKRGPTGGNWQTQEDLDAHAEFVAAEETAAPAPKKAAAKRVRSRATKKVASAEPDFG